jgi:hypothetical protein
MKKTELQAREKVARASSFQEERKRKKKKI